MYFGNNTLPARDRTRLEIVLNILLYLDWVLLQNVIYKEVLALASAGTGVNVAKVKGEYVNMEKVKARPQLASSAQLSN